MKKVFLVFIGIISACILSEVILHIIKAPMLFDKGTTESWIQDSDQFLKSMYLEIYDDFYKLQGDKYVVQRSWLYASDDFKINDTIPKFKDADVKRLFLMGESVAHFYPEHMIIDALKTLSPSKKFEIINAGVGAYDSYRIERLVREVISNHKPDYIIMMIGNNDSEFTPSVINYLPYRYAIFRKSYVLNYLSNVLMPRYDYGFDTAQPFFEKNVKKMIKAAKGKCPIIFVTLPQNVYTKGYYEETYDKSSLVVKNINDINNISRRRDFLRTLPQKYNWVKVADFDKILKSFIPQPGWDIFEDWCHFHPPVYETISKILASEILQKDIEITEQDFQFNH